ncbi:sensor histidine kinase [Roseomonas sp. CCTCC AB2023176]|uniref:sensor histidine kinase n=1 Tax=Roseomonas sp. CCTCC AB2023176 TaxID=3342640 RepID=UPI0035D6230D
MPFHELVHRVVGFSRGLPTIIRFAATIAIVLMLFLIRQVAAGMLPPGYPFLLFFVAILLCSTLFDRGSGLVATFASATLATYFYLEPVGSFRIADPRDTLALALFVVIGATMAFIIEALHVAVENFSRSQRARTLLLREFRHRTRNDLNALVALLNLRARAAPSEAAREGLLEAATHAMAMARVHTHLTPVEDTAEGDPAMVNTGDFIPRLCADIEAAQVGEGLRPVAVMAEAERLLLPSDRAVPLGLVVNEAVTNALKYAFPEERSGTIRVRLVREGEDFVLTIGDDGIGLTAADEPETALRGASRSVARDAGLGTRLLRGLSAQLRGRFSRVAPAEGGTLVTLRFPAGRPGE